MKTTQEQIERRRTFAIISHPDAGKTTLTEKLLLYGGAIALAGSVKGKKGTKHAVSDWMEIEKQRGISVTSSVLQFEYNDYCVNILDTPGHEDFSEDTYRTLMAADSAVMVIDASKGVEKQTRKLFKVCVMRGIPIFTFINKLDREAQAPLDLLDEIEKELGITTYPMNWPVGCGKEFRGVYDRRLGQLLSFEPTANQRMASKTNLNIDDPALVELIGENLYNTLRDDIDLLETAAEEFEHEKVLSGKLTPVFFGSALTNFGVEPFLEDFLRLTPTPLSRQCADGSSIPATSDKFSAFVFKIQANMNKAHRDRIAFMRICSGKFERTMEVLHVQSGKKQRLSQPQQLMAEARDIIDEAYAGDIIGIFDPGMFSIGDTLCSPNAQIRYEGMPTFAPEFFARVRQKDTLKRKQFVKGIEQIEREGGIQMFHEPFTGMEEIIVGVVGVLQFEVLEYRLKNEYGVDIIRENLPYQFIRWIDDKEINPRELNLSSSTKVVQDFSGQNLLLFADSWSIKWAEDKNPNLSLSEFGNAK